jgi:hypothetical protein
MAGASVRPLSFTGRTQMRASRPRREKVASAIAAVMSAASFASAVWFLHAGQSYMALWLLGGTFALFSSALAPQRLFLSVTAPLRQRVPLPPAAKVCTLLSTLCFLIGTIAWFEHLT